MENEGYEAQGADNRLLPSNSLIPTLPLIWELPRTRGTHISTVPLLSDV
jgi:hypothetical protein